MKAPKTQEIYAPKDVAIPLAREAGLRMPAKNGPEAGAVVRRFVGEREAGESFRGWMDRVGGASAIAAELKELDAFPTPQDNPDFYVDWTRPPSSPSNSGASECA